MGGPVEIIDGPLDIFAVSESPIHSALQIKSIGVGTAIFICGYQIEEGPGVLVGWQLKFKSCLE